MIQQLNGSRVDEARELLDLVVQKPVARAQLKPALDLGTAGAVRKTIRVMRE